jgi:hypothetical protein
MERVTLPMIDSKTNTTAEMLQSSSNSTLAEDILQVADLPTRIRAFDAYVDAALANPEQAPDYKVFQRELHMIAIAEGGEAGRLALRFQEVVQAKRAVIDIAKEQTRREANIVYERDIHDVHFVMDDEGNLCFTDFRDESETIWELDERQALAMLTFCGELVATAIAGAARNVTLARQQLKKEVAKITDGMTADEREQVAAALTAEEVIDDQPDGDLPFQFNIAPNCEGDILSHPPRVKRDAEGFQRLEQKNDDGWHDAGVVEKVTRVEPGLVVVMTDDAAYLMRAQDFDTPAE